MLKQEGIQVMFIIVMRLMSIFDYLSLNLKKKKYKVITFAKDVMSLQLIWNKVTKSPCKGTAKISKDV